MNRWDPSAPWQPPDDAPDYSVLLVFVSPVLDRFILARHRSRGWELPGGRVEPGESLLGAAAREWAEETGLPLAHLEPLLLHERPDGARGHVFLGSVYERPGTLEVTKPPSAEEKIEEVRPVRRLGEVAPLAFPDDPYDSIAEEVWKRTERGLWRRPPGEDLEGFRGRLGAHPDARPKDHRVIRHPASGPT